MDARAKSDAERWEVPYLPIDCEDIGRTYQAIIRINSQSGKGGVAYVLERTYGIQMPKRMHPEYGLVVTGLADAARPIQVWEAFQAEYIENKTPVELLDYDIDHKPDDVHRVHIAAKVRLDGETKTLNGRGNGPIAAFVDALASAGMKDFRLQDYSQHAIAQGSAADAVSFVEIQRIADNKLFWGASIDSNVEMGGLLALVSAFNRSHK